MVTLGARPVTLDDVIAVARDGDHVALAPDVASRLAAARAVVERHIRAGTPVYGLNSALGANVGAPLDASNLESFQRSAIRARAVGVGPLYDAASVRAMLFARAASLAVGGTGISPQALDAVVALLNARVHPSVPRYG